jgi:hypothetical protein
VLAPEGNINIARTTMNGDVLWVIFLAIFSLPQSHWQDSNSRSQEDVASVVPIDQGLQREKEIKRRRERKRERERERGIEERDRGEG